MSAECNSDVATNNNLNCCLLTQNWWPQDNIHHAISSSLSSCTTTRSSNYLWQQQSNHNQQSSESSSCEEDVVSISNTQTSATNLHQYQFLLGVDENSNSLITGETAASDHNHMIWSQLLLSSSTSGSAGSNTKNLFENNNEDVVSEISLLDGASNLSSKTCFDNQLGNNDHHDDYFHPYSNLLGRQLPLNYTQNSSMDPMFPTGSSHQYSNQGNNNVHQEEKLPRHNCGVLPEVDDNSTNLADFSISFGSYLTKPLVDPFNEFKPSLKTLNLCEHNSKHGLRSAKAQGTIPTCNTRSNGVEKQFPSEGKKRRSEDNSETYSKRQKNNESSAVSSAKIQVPKVKLADKITALQQIVSPFGKTDTASVLWETINYVRFLQEQIQLLSHAYMNSNTCKERWGGFDRKERGDLRSRGLCLVPISCTPQIYRESNNGSDYLIPAYRGCLYR